MKRFKFCGSGIRKRVDSCKTLIDIARPLYLRKSTLSDPPNSATPSLFTILCVLCTIYHILPPTSAPPSLRIRTGSSNPHGSLSPHKSLRIRRSRSASKSSGCFARSCCAPHAPPRPWTIAAAHCESTASRICGSMGPSGARCLSFQRLKVVGWGIRWAVLEVHVSEMFAGKVGDWRV